MALKHLLDSEYKLVVDDDILAITEMRRRHCNDITDYIGRIGGVLDP